MMKYWLCNEIFFLKEMIDLVADAYKGSVTRESCEILMKRGMAPSPNGKGYHFARDVRLKVSKFVNSSIINFQGIDKNFFLYFRLLV